MPNFVIYILCLIFAVFSTTAMGDTDTFSTTEFPNYFQELSGSTGAETRTTIALLEQVMQSVVNRVSAPMLTEKGKLEKVFVFRELVVRLQKGGLEEILISGGTVRDVWAYVYVYLVKERAKDPRRSIKDILLELRDAKVEIRGQDILGLGSDIDILVRDNDPRKVERAIQIAARISSDFEKAFNTNGLAESIRRSFFLRMDAHEFSKQTERTQSQGGSAIDQIAFSLTNGKIVEPSRTYAITEKFLKGEYDFYPPQSESALVEPLATLIRGFRALVQIPFLSLSQKSAERIRDSVDKLRRLIKAGYRPSEKELDQFAKLVRNSRFFGANNRLLRHLTGSPEELFYKLAASLASGKPLLPEFASYFPVEGKPRVRNGLPTELLTDPRQFIQEHTKNGFIYHGTPTIESGLAILRGGLFISSGAQGTAMFGRGAYTSNQLTVAQGYAGSTGLLFELEFNPSTIEHLNILDWEKVEGHPWIQEKIETASRRGIDLFEMLAKEHGIDVVLNKHILIQNAAILKFPKSMGDILKTLRFSILDLSLDITYRARMISIFDSLKKFVSILEGAMFAEIDEQYRRRILKDVLDEQVHADRSRKLDLIRSTRYLESVDSVMVRDTLLKYISNERELWAYRSQAIEELGKIQFKKAENIELMKYLILNDTNESIRESAARSLARNTEKRPELVDFLVHNRDKIYSFEILIYDIYAASPTYFQDPAVVERFIALAETGFKTDGILEALRHAGGNQGRIFQAMSRQFDRTSAGNARVTLAEGLLALGSHESKHVAVILGQLELGSGYSGAKEQALNALANLSSPSKEVVLALEKFIGKPRTNKGAVDANLAKANVLFAKWQNRFPGISSCKLIFSH